MRKTSIIYNKVILLVGCILAVAILFMPLSMRAQQVGEGRYTDDHPLVVMGDWEFPPYEYSNDNGKPDGFIVDLLSTILTAMDIPHKFVMKEKFLVMKAFEHREADLVVDMMGTYRSAPYIVSRNIVSYYKIKAATSIKSPMAVSFSQLDKSATIIHKLYDQDTENLLSKLVNDKKMTALPVNESMIRMSLNPDCYFIWGEEPLKWFVKELNLTDVKIVDLGIPVHEMHIVGHDKQLIDGIDDQYARLEQSGKLEVISHKWFHPEIEHNDTSPVAIYVSMVILLVVILLLLLNRLAKSRAMAATRKTKELESMMLQSLSMSNYSIIEYDCNTGRFSNRHGTIVPPQGTDRREFFNHFHPKEREIVKEKFMELLEGKITTVDLNMMWLPYGAQQPSSDADDDAGWQHIHGNAMVEVDEMKCIRRLLLTVKFVTDEVRQERINSQLGSRYNKIFDTSMIAMSFYDKDGKLIDLNQQMRDLCEFGGPEGNIFRETNLFDQPLFRDDLKPNTEEQFHVCQHLHFAERGLDKYLELRVMPTTEENGKLAYYTITARDITDERTISMEQRRHDKELSVANKQINTYEQQLQYLLQHCDMFVWEFDLATRHIKFSRSLTNVVFSDSRDVYMSWLFEDEREQADRNLVETMMKGKDFNTIHHFTHTPVNDSPCWYALTGTPTFNSNNQFVGYFGIARDITKLMQTQEKLRQETRRADDSGKLKSVFLANMTHEIRTPLNAIVGFSDLLQVVDEPADRREFIRIIRNNCDMLLRLIDDIIEASNMNQGPIAVDPKEVDFALAFNDICQTLAQRVQEPGVEFIVDNPYQSFVTTLDKGRMQQVITNFTTNAVKYTKQGHIKVGYRYMAEHDLPRHSPLTAHHHSQAESASGPHDSRVAPNDTPSKGIYMYCEDTGAGIPKEKQASVFDRFVKLNDFVQGTGLGLSICKTIADRCDGHIGVDSEGEGQGSTFWIWIPCEQKTTHD